MVPRARASVRLRVQCGQGTGLRTANRVLAYSDHSAAYGDRGKLKPGLKPFDFNSSRARQ